MSDQTWCPYHSRLVPPTHPCLTVYDVPKKPEPERIGGKSGCTVTQAKAKFSTDHYNPRQAAYELEHLRGKLAELADQHPNLRRMAIAFGVPVAPLPRKTYGPHRPEDAPSTVTIFAMPEDFEAPLPPELVRQRERELINRHANGGDR